jgi:hypothetical protein
MENIHFVGELLVAAYLLLQYCRDAGCPADRLSDLIWTKEEKLVLTTPDPSDGVRACIFHHAAVTRAQNEEFS